jgi:hypothetical protein
MRVCMYVCMYVCMHLYACIYQCVCMVVYPARVRLMEPAPLSQGLVSEQDIDTALRRTLGLRFRLGLFDPIEQQPLWHGTCLWSCVCVV